MTANAFQPLIAKECSNRGLDPLLITAIIQIESSFNPWAIRYEAASKYQVVAAQYARLVHISLATEQIAQKFSWGLGQVMGSTARWLGFQGILPQLCDPETGIHWMCEYFTKNCLKYTKLEEQIAAYNAGSPRRTPEGALVNQEYVYKVLNVYRSYQ